MAGVILGGRLGYCLLYEPRATFTDPLYFFTVWKGGMASHGGILGVILVMIFYARAAKIPFYNLADATALLRADLPRPRALREFPQRRTVGPSHRRLVGRGFSRARRWSIGINVPRYPSQLIEALLEGLLLQLVLIAVRLSTRREGAVALTFMAGYAILRIVGEQFREPDEDIGFLVRRASRRASCSPAIMLLVTAVLA